MPAQTVNSYLGDFFDEILIVNDTLNLCVTNRCPLILHTRYLTGLKNTNQSPKQRSY